MTQVSFKNATFNGELLFDQASLNLTSVIRGRATVDYNSQSQAFSVSIDKYLVHLKHEESTEINALVLKNITSLSIEELKGDWFKLATNISSYWVHRQLRQRCDFIAYSEPPASFDFEKERNMSFGCTTGGVMISPYAHKAEISLSENVKTINAAQVILHSAVPGVSDVNYTLEKGESAFPYRLGLRYTDETQNASMLLINKKIVTREEALTTAPAVAYKDTVLRTDSAGVRSIRVRTEEELYKPLVVVVPKGWHYMIEEPTEPLSSEQLQSYAAKASAHRNARKPRRHIIIAGSYDPGTGQTIE